MSDPRIRLLFTPAELAALGRCTECGWHEPTQGHHPHCTDREMED
jgi:hypothetical protein